MNRTQDQKPSYLMLFSSGELHRRDELFSKVYEACDLCPNECLIKRKNGERGNCNGGSEAVVSGAVPHFGEEDPLVGTHGSGTIFFCNCPLHCIYCQNHRISQSAEGRVVTDRQLGELMLSLQNRGCHNINLVTPTHYLPNIIRALIYAVPSGLDIPLVYNTSGFESIKTLRSLEGIIDIYMPDFKYWDEENALRYSGIRRYPESAREALKEMYRQVGNLKCDAEGVAYRGLLVRHLVLPNDVAGSFEIIRFISKEISPATYVNIMAQYRPSYKARGEDKLSRAPNDEEYKRVIRFAGSVGLARGFKA